MDPDNEFSDIRQKFSYQFIPVPSGHFPFELQGNNLKTIRKLDYEARPSWNITIESSDDGDPVMAVNRTFVISVQG